MELEFLNLEGCSSEEICHLMEILSLSGEKRRENCEEGRNGGHREEVSLSSSQEPIHLNLHHHHPPYPPPSLGHLHMSTNQHEEDQQQQGGFHHPTSLGPPPPFPNVYINNVTANVNLHAPSSEAPNGVVGNPTNTNGTGGPPPTGIPVSGGVGAPPPPPPVLAATAYPIHQLLLPGYNLSLSLPPPLVPFNPPPRVPLRNPLLDPHLLNQKQYLLQLQQQQARFHHFPPPPIYHPHPPPPQPPPPPSIPPETAAPKQQPPKPDVIEFGGPPIFQDKTVSAKPSKPDKCQDKPPQEPPSKDPPELPRAHIDEQKSWASLFRNSSSEDRSTSSNEATAEKNSGAKPTARIMPNNASAGNEAEIPSNIDIEFLNSKEGKLADFLKNYVLNHKSLSLRPRGLSNRSNWCFVNAILQALVGCPPFFNLIRALPPLVLEEGSILKSLFEFMSEFSSMEKISKQHHRRNKKAEDLVTGKTFEATSIYRALLTFSSTDTFKVIEGRQEDAEEFLTFLLNGVNDEMLAVLKKLNEKPQDERVHAEEDHNTDDWKEVGPKNKGCVTRRQTLGNTPLASMVQGQIRSCVTHSGSEPTATLQPFFTLQLDIQSEAIRSVSDALINNFSMESLDGYVCSKTKVEIEASRSLSIEELPPILILHLKRFVYDETSGGCQKLLKRIDFPVDLEITKEILSPNSKTKYHPRQRQYKLFAVVYHNGGEATKGHYVTDVFQAGPSTWLRCDDCKVESVTETSVMTHTHNSLPYILFYRRCDTMVGADKPSKN